MRKTDVVLVVFLVLVLLISLAVNCASRRPSATALALLETKQWLSDQVGKLDYDGALRVFGSPRAIAEGETVLVARWSSSPEAHTWREIPSTGYKMELWFDNTTKILIKQDFVRWDRWEILQGY